jgi:hypothetical protein
MAINTRGFQVSAMPQYTPVDPSLVAYNPQETTQGLLQALNAVETDRQMRAQRAARAERDLLAGKRIAATEAEYDSILSRLPAQDRGILAQLAADERMRPTATEARIAQDTATAMSAVPVARSSVDQANLQGAVARSSLPNVSIAAEAERLGNQGIIDDALISQATLEQRRQAAIDAAVVNAARAGSARSNIPLSVQTEADAAERAALDAAAAVDDFPTDRTNRLRAAELDLAVKEAQAANLNAEAIERLLSKPSATIEDQMKRAQAASTLAKSLREQNVKGERITVLEYMVRTRGADGQPRSGVILNPAAERQIQAIDILESIAQDAILGKDINPADEKPSSDAPKRTRYVPQGGEMIPVIY